MDTKLYREPLTHNPRVASLEDLKRIRFGTSNGIIQTTQTPPQDVAEPAKGSAILKAPDSDDSPSKRRVISPQERIAILAEVAQPGAKPRDVAAKHGISPASIYLWQQKLVDKPRGRPPGPGKPGKRRRIMPDRGARPERAAHDSGTTPLQGLDDIYDALQRVLEDAAAAVRGVDEIRGKLKSIFGG